MNIAIIGACNIDITTTLQNEPKLYDSNPGKISTSIGGVGQNIANNLCLMGQNVSMYTAISTDNYGNQIKEHCKKVGINLDHAIYLDKPSSIYLCINNPNGDLIIGSSDMDIIDNISIDYIKANIDELNKADIVVFDTNLTKETISYILENVKVPTFADTVSCVKSVKLVEGLKQAKNPTLYAIKTNTLEAEVLVGFPLKTNRDYRKACDILHDLGILNVCITMGKDGVFYSSETETVITECPDTNIINTTGAGDSFLAGMIYGFTLNSTPIETVKYGLSASKITLESLDAVSKEMSEKNLKRTFNEMKL